jgi:uncharacterized protein involved in response to NO
MQIDRRGRKRTGPAILSYGFRPFFLGSAIYAAVAVPAWLWMYGSGVEAGGVFDGPSWHAHEMIFGYLGAVIAGFVLTAVPNWTGRLPLSGYPLALLFLSWLAGRVAVSAVGDPLLASLFDLAFPVALAGSVWREVIAGKNWRNLPVAGLLTLFALANSLHHAENLWPVLDGTGLRLALGVAATMIALIGGRITPSFTRNWLAKRKSDHLPASFGTTDRVALAATALGTAGWVFLPYHRASGTLLALAGLLLIGRLARWRGLTTWREPIVLILHLGYLWLAASLLLLGCSILAPETMPQSSALHALTAGAIATMTLAVMTRASRGHTGRAIEADPATIAIYVLASVGALLRVLAPLLPTFYMELLTAGGALWSSAFALFAVWYGPMLLRARVDG